MGRFSLCYPYRLASIVAFVSAAAAVLCLGAVTPAPVLVSRPPGSIYSVDVLVARLEQDPARWLGRTVRVHAVAWFCIGWSATRRPPCIDPRPALFDTNLQPEVALLMPPPSAAQSILARLRALPIMGSLIPSPPAPRWGIPADYAVRLARVRCTDSITPCYAYAALLL